MQRARQRWFYTFATLASISITGCHGYSARPTPAPSRTKQFVASNARVTRTNGARIELTGAYVEGDSITGFTAQLPTRRVAIAIRDIARVESNEVQMGKTLRYTLGVFAGTVLVVMILMSA